ncbi:unnamed protein product [Lepeophtheirus salmonis]|uniref:(salmon louse) hypothetical protein n=1 Tax=Lepeophtheirus salmonis TaxID=72036 RepID=A0A7R8CN68_LEPSM|nr:unnamed protein product [Lepeophtheirus salmonis]CAF2872651.1 unnamed protein product [Lepeophtheirus salmonis]
MLLHDTIYLLFFISLTQGIPTQDYYSDEYYNDDDYSEQLDLMVNEGETIKLPCLIDLHAQGFAVIWKKEPGNHIVAVENQVIDRKDTRIKLDQAPKGRGGNTLIISLSEESDAGEYRCQISAYKPTVLKHTVKIRVAPKIRPIPSNGLLIVKEGEAATLSCEMMKGNPPPKMTWRRKERKLPSGEEELNGLSLTFKESTRHHSGIYICAADNGFGAPATAQITLNVHHKPSIETDQTYIHTRSNDETEVVCLVHASPKASVKWLKNGTPLKEGEGIVSDRGNRHTLLLPGITHSTFGVYTCQAENEFGFDEEKTTVSGKAAPAKVKSDPEGLEKNRFSMEWVSESISNITAFKLQYHQEDFEDWSEIQVEATDHGDNYYSGSHVLDNLRSATRYIARIASKNDYGYSEFSEPFVFATKGAGPKHQPSTGTSSGFQILSQTYKQSSTPIPL